MNQLVVVLCLSFTMLLGSMKAMSAVDMYGGWALYRSGDYLSAIQAWTHLAEVEDISNPEYKNHLATMYRRGPIEIHNPATAIKWYSQAAKLGSLEGIVFLGRMYERGEGVTQDYKAAAKWYKLAADKGYSSDLFRLSALKAGDRSSLKFWRFLAKLGSVDAKINLGTMYFIGEGVFQDYNRAFNWYKLAAEQGHVGAQKKLGKMYRYGLGTKKLPIISQMWYTLAAWQGDGAAVTIKNIYESRMTFPQIEEVQKLARKCVRNNYVGC